VACQRFKGRRLDHLLCFSKRHAFSELKLASSNIEQVDPALSSPEISESPSSDSSQFKMLAGYLTFAAIVINEAGVGTTKAQITRIVSDMSGRMMQLGTGLTCSQQLSIGGREKYAGLREGFVLASVKPNANQTEVVVQGNLVEDSAMS
jgi:hypothetical protein